MTQKYTPLKDHDTPIKVLFTGYLCAVGVGYLFALIQILFTHGMADGKFGLSIDDIVYSYYGNRSGTVLESKLNGSMKENASEAQRFQIMEWVRDSAEQDNYQSSGVASIIEERCVMCHNKDAVGIPNFSEFENLKKLTQEDTGATFSSLTRVSHIHLFGISFIFMFIGIIFSFSETTPNSYKCVAIGMPYIFLVADILSWWLTKIHPLFASLVIIAGMGMAVSFIYMWFTSLAEMWVYHYVFERKCGIIGEKTRALVKSVFTPERCAALRTYRISFWEFIRQIWSNIIFPGINSLVHKLLNFAAKTDSN